MEQNDVMYAIWAKLTGSQEDQKATQTVAVELSFSMVCDESYIILVSDKHSRDGMPTRHYEVTIREYSLDEAESKHLDAYQEYQFNGGDLSYTEWLPLFARYQSYQDITNRDWWKKNIDMVNRLEAQLKF